MKVKNKNKNKNKNKGIWERIRKKSK